jgi:hypothetical protein
MVVVECYARRKGSANSLKTMGIQTNFFHTITRAGCKSPATSFYWYTNVSSDCRSEGIALCSRHKTERLTFLNNMTQEISETDFAVRSVMLV